MTYKNLYNQWLDEIYQDAISQISFLNGVNAGVLMEEHDPVAYRDGFADFIDGLKDVRCEECDARDVSRERVNDSCMDDEVKCGVCAGEEFECAVCNEVLPVSENCGVCESCAARMEDQDEEHDS